MTYLWMGIILAIFGAILIVDKIQYKHVVSMPEEEEEAEEGINWTTNQFETYILIAWKYMHISGYDYLRINN